MARDEGLELVRGHADGRASLAAIRRDGSWPVWIKRQTVEVLTFRRAATSGTLRRLAYSLVLMFPSVPIRVEVRSARRLKALLHRFESGPRL
jgi:hypothetical protein